MLTGDSTVHPIRGSIGHLEESVYGLTQPVPETVGDTIRIYEYMRPGEAREAHAMKRKRATANLPREPDNSGICFSLLGRVK